MMTGGVGVNYYKMLLYQRSVTYVAAGGLSLLSSHYCGVPVAMGEVATVGHMAHTQLLLAPTAATGSLTSVDYNIR
jgi:hypothetical protein